MTATDVVSITGLEVETVIGIHPWERQMRQTLRFDLELGTDVARAAAADAIGSTLDYGAVAQALIEFGATQELHLIETFAERAAQMLHERFALKWLRLTLHKPGALREADEVGVRIERSWK